MPWEVGGTTPRPVELGDAVHNIVVLLHDGEMDADRQAWISYVEDTQRAMAERGDFDTYVPFGDPDGLPGLRCDRDRNVQYARRDRWRELDAAARTCACFCIWCSRFANTFANRSAATASSCS